MSAVDLATLRDGDTVLLRAEVIGPRRIALTGDRINVNIGGFAYGAKCSDIVSVEPRRLAVGDKVRMSDGGKEGEILAMYGVIAWVDFGCVAPDTRRISDLVRS